MSDPYDFLDDPTVNQTDFSNEGRSGASIGNVSPGADIFEQDPTNFSNEGRSGTSIGNVSPGSNIPTTNLGNPTSDQSLIDTVSNWIKHNKELADTIFGGVGTAFRNQAAKDAANASFDQRVALLNLQNQQLIDAQKRYSDSITNMAAPAQGIIGRAMINNLRGAK